MAAEPPVLHRMAVDLSSRHPTRTSLDSKDASDTSDPGSELGSSYAAAAPVEPAPTYSTGVYGTSVQSTDVPAVAPYDADPMVPNPGYSSVSDTGFDRPGGDPTR